MTLFAQPVEPDDTLGIAMAEATPDLDHDGGDTRDEAPAMSKRAARSRAKILAAATDLLVESGPRSVTVDAVEAASGVAKSTLYRHFASRDELLVEVVRCKITQLDEPPTEEGFETALRTMVRQTATSFTAPEWARMFPAIVSLRTTMPELDAMLHADRDDKSEMVRRLLDAGITEGIVPTSLDVDTAINVLIGPLVLAAIIEAEHPGEQAMLDLADFVVARFLASYAS